MNKKRLAGAGAITGVLAAILLPSPSAFAAPVPCGDANFVKITYQGNGGPSPTVCFAGAGRNVIMWTVPGNPSAIWMEHLHTGNNDISYEDCNNDVVHYPRNKNIRFNYLPCVEAITIK